MNNCLILNLNLFFRLKSRAKKISCDESVVGFVFDDNRFTTDGWLHMEQTELRGRCVPNLQ